MAARRLRGLVKFLPDYGWQPTVLTIKPLGENETYPSSLRVIETCYEDRIITWKKRLGIDLDQTFHENFNIKTYKNRVNLLDIILRSWKEIFAYPDAQKSWHKPAYDACDELFEKEHFDAIISSSGPYTSHIIAKSLKTKYKIPWIADLRDLWTQSHFYPYSSKRKFIEKRLEVRTLATADALVTVSKPLAEKLKELHVRNDIYVITNGFDPEEISQNRILSEKFNIIYSGQLRKGKQDPEPLFSALETLISNKFVDPIDLLVEFYGPTTGGWLERDIELHKLSNIVKNRGFKPRKEILKKQRQAQILLVLDWNDPKETGVYTGKIFEYLAARRPILSIGISKGVVEELLSKTKAGVHISNHYELENYIKAAYTDYKINGNIGYKGIDSELKKYSQNEMAKKFAEILDRF